MSSLYSHPDFPNKGPKDINKELMNRISSNPLRLLLPQHITNYIQALWTKKAAGQPVTFTDIFGMLIGETLIPAVRAVVFIFMRFLISSSPYCSAVRQSSTSLTFPLFSFEMTSQRGLFKFFIFILCVFSCVSSPPFLFLHFVLFLLRFKDCVLFYQRMDIKLSSIQEKVNQAQSPLPLFTCLHVKPDVSELMFAGNYLSFCEYRIAFMLNCVLHLPNVPSENCFSYVINS